MSAPDNMAFIILLSAGLVMAAGLSVALGVAARRCRELARQNASLQKSLAEMRQGAGRQAEPAGPQAGLKMIGGNRKLHQKILRDFGGKYRDFEAECAALLEAGNLGDLERLAHTLKGNAGMLGLAGLSAASADLEVLARQQAQAGCRHALQTLVRILGPALETVRTESERLERESRQEAGPPALAPADSISAGEVLARARDLLERGEYGAHELLARLKGQPELADCRGEFDRVCALVDTGDYDDACRELEQLMGAGKIR